MAAARFNDSNGNDTNVVMMRMMLGGLSERLAVLSAPPHAIKVKARSQALNRANPAGFFMTGVSVAPGVLSPENT